jgi:hypothetical protein
MIRTLDYIAHEALRTATTYFGPGYHSIKWLAEVQGSNKAVITNPVGKWAGRLKARKNSGLIPSSLPAFVVIDGDGRQVAVCHYYKSRLTDSDPEPDEYEDEDYDDSSSPEEQ